MKKIVFALALPLLIASCKNDKPVPSVEQQEQGTLPKTPDSTATKPVDTLATTDAWYGNYSGSLPCGDCKGILTRITLRKDNTYQLQSQYLGKETKPTIYKGSYNLDPDKHVVTLDAEGDHLKFLVVEKDSMIIKLDKFGAREQGAPFARYFLHKVL
ncbi:MAG: copper resistance protein NlpE [Flavobacterium sp.]